MKKLHTNEFSKTWNDKSTEKLVELSPAEKKNLAFSWLEYNDHYLQQVLDQLDFEPLTSPEEIWEVKDKLLTLSNQQFRREFDVFISALPASQDAWGEIDTWFDANWQRFASEL